MYKYTYKGKGGIEARVVEHSAADITELFTLELKYPRFIHAEFMTHRMFSRNASSSRAIPVNKILDNITEEPATPVHWGKNQPGMQAREELDDTEGKRIWGVATKRAVEAADYMNHAGYHKQIVNRITEPYQFIKVVVTATEWDNFFKLRLHEDAQPEIYELARCMFEAMEASDPRYIEVDDPIPYHLPFIRMNDLEYWAIDEVSTEDLIKASVARCARVSYMNHDGTNPDIRKDIELHDRLLEAGHMSPFEHVARPMSMEPIGMQEDGAIFETGVTHFDKHGYCWSNNFKDWIQYRALLEKKDD